MSSFTVPASFPALLSETSKSNLYKRSSCLIVPEPVIRPAGRTFTLTVLRTVCPGDLAFDAQLVSTAIGIAGAFGTQLHLQRADDLPVALDGFIALDIDDLALRFDTAHCG